ALASGNSEQPATYEQTAAARETATGILSFADALLATGSTTPSARVAVPVGQPGWGRAVGEQVVWFVSQNIQSASLKLNPQHLGPLELQLRMDGDKASIAFASQHAAVREALESSLPRLRDMLAEQGLNLVNVNVSQHDAGSRREQASDGNRAGASTRTASMEELLPVAGGMPGAITGRGLVDYYV
ncbi:MAG: flagellar hook-length control protein FliK, partial [Gammaproteobacteria bacterium]